jgi:hypothetical protein
VPGSGCTSGARALSARRRPRSRRNETGRPTEPRPRARADCRGVRRPSRPPSDALIRPVSRCPGGLTSGVHRGWPRSVGCALARRSSEKRTVGCVGDIENQTAARRRQSARRTPAAPPRVPDATTRLFTSLATARQSVSNTSACWSRQSPTASPTGPSAAITRTSRPPVASSTISTGLTSRTRATSVQMPFEPRRCRRILQPPCLLGARTIACACSLPAPTGQC